MREIKFRAWDKQKHEWTSFDMGWSLDEQNGYLTFHPMPAPEASEQLEIMQFTGLLDAKGKEIYEGDIIQHYLTYEDDEDHIRKHPPVRVVIWVEDAASFGSKGNNSVIFHRQDGYKEYEVIGNIYQNPELIT